MTARAVSMTYRSEIVTRRWMATVIDGIVLLVIGGIGGAALRPQGMAGGVFLLFGLPFLYYFALETTVGRTVGKLVTGIIVVDDAGAIPRPKAVLIRTLLRAIEVNPFLFGAIPAGIIADRSVAHQRWGDMLAGTYVVFVGDLPKVHAPHVVDDSASHAEA
jgi:uncharacterized RDD family membrane protein YckC